MAESFEADLLAKFNAAAEYLRTVTSSLQAEQLLQFYAYYKQATVGKCQTLRPRWYEFEAKQKWEAWNNLEDMRKDEAMLCYINLLSEVCPDWESSKQEGNNGWVVVSCMANQEDRLEESEKNIFDRVKEGDVEKVKLFAQENDINVVDEEGMGLLHWASDRGNADMVKCIVNLNANLDLKDNSGQTALHYACSCGHFEVVKLLLEKGANPNVTCEEGCSPIDIATEDAIRSLMQSALSQV